MPKAKSTNLQDLISQPIWKPCSSKDTKMASSPLKSKSSFHARSISLPSRSNPIVPQFDEHLCRLRASEAATSSSTLTDRLSDLEELYDCVDYLLLLPHTQRVFARERHEKWVDEALDGYLRLLDVSGTIRDVLSQMKQHVQELLSILRRRRDPNHFSEYLTLIKKAKKLIQKSLKDLKSIKSKHISTALDKEQVTMSTVCMLTELEEVTIAVFESLLSYIMGQSRPSSWSLVSKILHRKSIESQGEEIDTNEFQSVDAALQFLMGVKVTKFEDVQNQLAKLSFSIEDLEEGLESLFRHLIKTRVSLLNILNH